MDHKTRIRTLIQSIAKGARLTLATTLTLAFGATMVWGIVSIFNNEQPTVLAIDDFENRDYSVFKTYQANQVNALNETCHSVGDTWNECCGSCTSKKVTCTHVHYDSATGCNVCDAWDVGSCDQFDMACGTDCGNERPKVATTITWYCNSLDGNGRCEGANAIAVKEYGRFCSGSLPLPEICYAKQEDDYARDDGSWACGVADWSSFISPARITPGDPNNPVCKPQQPASCSNIAGTEGTVQPGQSLSYTGTINDGSPRDLKWYKTINGVEELITDDDNTFTVNAVAPQSGNMSVRLSVNGDNVPACQKAVTVNVPQPSASCNYKDESGSDDIVNPLERISYTVQLEVKDVAVDKLEFTDDFDETKVTIDESVFSGLSMNGWECDVLLDEVINNQYILCYTNNKIKPVTPKTYEIRYAAVVNHNATGTIVNRITDVNGYVGGNHIDNVTISPKCTKALTVDVPQPEFGCINKTASVTENAVAGQEIKYTINYLAENFAGTYNIDIVDVIPTGTHWDSNRSSISVLPNNNVASCSYIASTNRIECKAGQSGSINFNVYVDDNIDSITSITNNAVVTYAGITDQCSVNTTVYNPTPKAVCEDKSSNVTSAKNGDTIEYTVTAKLAETGADELVIVDDFDETKVSIDPTKVTVTPGEEMVTDCTIEDRSGNKVLKCSAHMFEGEGKLNPNTYAFKYTATVLGSVVNGNIDNKVIETYAMRNGTRYADSNTVDSCSNQVTVIEPKLNCNDKVADKVSVKEGDIITYTVSLNLTGTPADRLAFVDNYDESLVQIVANSWKGDLKINCTDKNGELSCEAYSPLTMIDAIKEGSYTFTYQAKVIANVTKVAINQITSATAIRRTVRFTNDNTETACTAEVQIKENIPSVDCIEKTVSPSTNVKVGDEIAYSIRYTSLNQDGKVHIADTLNSEYFQFTRFDENSENFCNINNSTVSCDVPENVGGTITFYVRVLKAGTELNNTATVSGDNKSDTCSVPVDVREKTKSLECVSKVADNTNADYDENVTFTITYKNTGETTLNGVRLVDAMPEGMTFVSSLDNACHKMNGYVGTGEMIECTSDADLEAGDTALFRITAKITTKNGGILVNKISHLSSGDVDGETTDCSENVAVGLPEPKVSVTKETVTPQDRTVVLGEDAETPEDYVVYKLVVTNEGPTKLVVVPVFDTFSALDYKFIDANPDETSVTTTNATTIVYWQNIGALNPGESKTLMVKLQALETYPDDVNGNTLPNYVTVKDVIDENGVEANEDKDNDYVKVTGSILGTELDFVIDKSLVSENPTKGGKLVTFKIVVTNVGTAEISEIKFTDTYDVNYLTFSDFSNDISHLQKLYTIDAVNGVFVHNDLLHGYGDEKLDPNEKVEFTVSFIAKDKKGETTNWAKAVVEDMTREDYAKVKIVAEELSKTGSNILLPIAIGVVMTAILGKKVLVKEKK